MFRKLTFLQVYLLIAIALGAASLHLVPLVQVAKSTDSSSSCSNEGATWNPETGTCKCPDIQIWENQGCRAGPPIADDADNASDRTNVDSGEDEQAIFIPDTVN